MINRVTSMLDFPRTVRGKLLFGFLAMVALVLALGLAGSMTIARTGQIVAETYNRPLMAINHARSASLAFAQMQNKLLRGRLALDTAPAAAVLLPQMMQDLLLDLEVVTERSLTTDAVPLIESARTNILDWVVGADETLRTRDETHVKELAALAERIAEDLDAIAELQTGEAFRERRAALRAVDGLVLLSRLAGVAALLLGIAVAYVVARAILRPLGAAVVVARRIAAGDLDTRVPEGGRDESGTLLRTMKLMLENIRAMMSRETELRQAAQIRLVEALESSSEAVVLVGRTGEILLANSQAKGMFGTLAGAVDPGRRFSDTFGDQGRPHAVGLPDPATGEPDEMRLPDGRWLRVSRSRTQEGGAFYLWAEITAAKIREAQYLKAKDLAESASEAKSRFLANMSHELKTPLNAIIGFSEIIQGEMFGPVGSPQYAEYAGDILASGRRLLAIVDDVLDLSKSDAGRLELKLGEVELHDIVAAAVAAVRDRAAAAGLALDLAPPVGEILVTADVGRLRKALVNILDNAIKFTKPGGRVTVALAHDGARATVSVADTGIGMRPEDVPLALERFGQVDSKLARAYEGAGLGLPLANAIIAAHGGSLAIDSALGEGTRVDVTLPLYSDAAEAPPRAASA